VKVGPTIVGLATLGSQRPAIKHPKIVPLASLPFAEEVQRSDAEAARKQLAHDGLVSLTYDGDVLAFSEIAVDPNAFGEDHEVDDVVVVTANRNGWRGRKGRIAVVREGKFFAVDTGDEFPGVLRWLASDEVVADDGTVTFRETRESNMTDAEIKAAIEAGIKTAVAPIQQQNDELKEQIKSFSETSQRKADAKAFCETLSSDRKATAPLPRLFVEKGEEILSSPELTDGLRKEVKALMSLAPGAFVAHDDKKGKNFSEGEGGEDDGDDPEAVLALRPRHFADLDGNEKIIAKGAIAFAEAYPEKIKDCKTEMQRVDVLRKHVMARESRESAAN
jgi:hypothetical protein